MTEALPSSDVAALARFSAELSSEPAFWWYPGGRIWHVNDAVCTHLGCARGEVLGRSIGEIVVTLEDASELDSLEARVRQQRRVVLDGRMKRENGDLVSARLTVSCFLIDGGEYWCGTVGLPSSADSTESRAICPSDEVFDRVPVGLYRSTPAGDLLAANRAIIDLLGYPDRESMLCADVIQLYVDRADRERLAQQLDVGGIVHGFEARLRRCDGAVIWVRLDTRAVRTEDGEILFYEGAMQNVTESREAMDRLLHDALHHPLTGLPNRSLFRDRLKQAIDWTKRNPQRSFAVMMLGLDRFKLVNESLGRDRGDELLVEVAELLESIVRPTDTLAHFGGDEFGVLLEEIDDPGEAVLVAERAIGSVQQAFHLGEHDVFTSVSVGISIHQRGETTPDRLIRDADAALSGAKAAGGGRHVIFDHEMQRRSVERLRLETDLRRALERDEFEVHYQPILALDSGELLGFEGLLRWRHPERGLLLPEDFLDVAEETGLMLPIGDQVMEQVTSQLAKWQPIGPHEEPLFVSVNLSHRQFFRPDLVGWVARALEREGLDPRALALELTERIVMEGSDAPVDLTRDLRELGVRLFLDDFGTGYSSLATLHLFPFDVLKIDRSFIHRMNGTSKMVKAIVDLSGDLGLRVVGEGIETVEQLETLKSLGCENGQGWYFSYALPPAEADRMVELADHGLPPQQKHA